MLFMNHKLVSCSGVWPLETKFAETADEFLTEDPWVFVTNLPEGHR